MRFSCALWRMIRFLIYMIAQGKDPKRQECSAPAGLGGPHCYPELAGTLELPRWRGAAAPAGSQEQAQLGFAQVSLLHFQTQLRPPPGDSHLAGVPALTIPSL